MKNIIIIGSRGYECNYGGRETFVTNLINNYKDEDVRFFVPELSNKMNSEIEIKNGVICKQIFIPKQGFFTMFAFTIKSIFYYSKFIKKEKLKNTIMYLLGVRGGIGLFFLKNKLKKLGVTIISNPGSIESNKWVERKLNSISEKYIIKLSDLIICDSKVIENYIKNKYSKYNITTKFIPYGAYLNNIKDVDKKTRVFMEKNNIKRREYYLVVGRFIEENNIELIIKEFMLSNTNKDLVIVTNIEKNKFYERLVETTNLTKDKRIKFVGPVYDEDILTRLRVNAKGYIHGHKTGGTNLSLLEALANTDINILYDAPYNIEVGKDSCLYFNSEAFSLRDVIDKVDKFKSKEALEYGNKAKERIKEEYTWDLIIKKHKKVFNNKHK